MVRKTNIFKNISKTCNMAKPIKETPILKGKDAKKFNKDIEQSKHQTVSVAVKERMQTNYLTLKSIAKF